MKKTNSKKIYSILKLKNKHPSKRGKGILQKRGQTAYQEAAPKGTKSLYKILISYLGGIASAA
jgi:hypothetical protein